MSIDDIAIFFSILATVCGIYSRAPKVYKIYTTQPLSIDDLSTDTIALNIGLNSCILFYVIIYVHYPIIIHCSIMIILEVLLLYMKNTHGSLKKSSSQTNLLEMEEV